MKKRLINYALKLCCWFYGAGMVILVQNGWLNWLEFWVINAVGLILIYVSYSVKHTGVRELLSMFTPFLKGTYNVYNNQVLPYPAKAMSINMSFDNEGRLNQQAQQAITFDVFTHCLIDTLEYVFSAVNPDITANREFGVFIYWDRLFGIKLPILVLRARFDVTDRLLLHAKLFVLWLRVASALKLAQVLTTELKDHTSEDYRSKLHLRVTWFI